MTDFQKLSYEGVFDTIEIRYDIIVIAGILGLLLLGPSQASKDVKFQLYTKTSPIKPYNLDDTYIGLKAGKPIIIVIHGFMGSGNTISVILIRNAYLYSQDVNLVIMDWEWLARGPSYQLASENAVIAAANVAEFIEGAIKKGFSRYNITVVGFSLGAQVAGLAANYMNSFTIHRIIALDAAKPIFDTLPNRDRLDASDADFVMSIHTSIGFMGFENPNGHVDFYPNGGKSPQPACAQEDLKMACSHFMAPLYFVESLYNKKGFVATKCDSWDNFVNDTCEDQEHIVMGDSTPSSARGLFYLRTNTEPPYGDAENNTAPLHKPAIFTEEHNYDTVDYNNLGEETTTARGNNSRRGKVLDGSASSYRTTPQAMLVIGFSLLLKL